MATEGVEVGSKMWLETKMMVGDGSDIEMNWIPEESKSDLSKNHQKKCLS